ncbi:hypothetical protein ACVLV4_000433 [Rathayibacter agropyri]
MSTTYVDNTLALSIRLKAINGKRTRRVEVEDIQEAVKAAEATLKSLGIRKADWKDNIAIDVNPERNRQPATSSYKYAATAINVVIARNSVGWYILEWDDKNALSPTVANRRNYFLDISEELLKFEEVKTALGIRTV